MYIHGSPQHRAHAHNPMCGVINSQCRSKELHIFVIIYVIILVFDGFTPPHFWTFWINFCFCKTVLLSLRDWGVIDRDGQWFGKGECNRLRSWTFLLRVIGPQLPKQRQFRYFQLPSIFPPKVHAVITSWSCSPPQCARPISKRASHALSRQTNQQIAWCFQPINIWPVRLYSCTPTPSSTEVTNGSILMRVVSN